MAATKDAIANHGDIWAPVRVARLVGCTGHSGRSLDQSSANGAPRYDAAELQFGVFRSTEEITPWIQYEVMNW
jgi:hypothetical protein